MFRTGLCVPALQNHFSTAALQIFLLIKQITQMSGRVGGEGPVVQLP